MTGYSNATIRKILHTKIKQWLDTVEESIRPRFEQDIIVTGGAIANFLLGEKANDYDVYFKTKETALLAAHYYTNIFNLTNKELKHEAAHNVNPEVRVEKRKNINGDVEERIIFYIKSAGVAAEGQETYKYFECFDPNETESFMDSLKNIKEDLTSKKYRPVFFTDNAITLSDKIQLITRFHGQPSEIHKYFDFVHATCSYDYENNELILPPEALRALLSKQLIYHGSMYPIASLMRVRKFIKRGFRITAGQMLKIIHQTQKIDFTNPNELTEQLIGVDFAYMNQLINALRNHKGPIDETYLATLLDTLFEEDI